MWFACVLVERKTRPSLGVRARLRRASLERRGLFACLGTRESFKTRRSLCDVHALYDLAEHDVLAVQPGCLGRAQEELRAYAVQTRLRNQFGTCSRGPRVSRETLPRERPYRSLVTGSLDAVS